MYVAFTRARDVLYIGIPGKEVNGLKTTGDLLQTIMERTPSKEPCTAVLHSYLYRDLFSIGTMPVYKEPTVEEDPWQFKSYPVSRENRTLKVRLRNDPYFVDEGGVFRTGRMYGNLMHRIFSRITSETDLEPVLTAMQREGLVPGKEREELDALIRKKLNDATVIQWFPVQGTKFVFNERSILCGDGNLIRPDRVIVDGDRVTVVDFKFGEQEKPSYLNQVGNYIEQLGKMSYREVEGFVWYVMLDKIVKV
jgi:ATP-dependent helicase/nuclease subunit A